MKRLLTPQEHALWRRSLRGVKPLKPENGSLPLAGAGSKKPDCQAPAKSGRQLGIAARTPSGAPRPHDAFNAGDPQLERRVRRGRAPIEARLDLHGYHHGPARAALLRFLTASRGNGYRCVLVVTGKGGRYSPAGRGIGHGGGVLRASMPGWLREDAFRQHVARAAEAHARHGGAGAFYVFLKAPLSGRRGRP